MTFETALRLSEILTALVFIEQSAEYLMGFRFERILLSGVASALTLLGLLGLGWIAQHRFHGP